MLQILKASAKVERERLSELLESQTAEIRRAFFVFASASNDAKTLRQVRELVQAGDVDGALEIVDRAIERLASQLASVFVDVAENEAATWGTRLGIAASFDVTTQRAAELMRANRLGLLRGFTRQQRTVTRNALVTGISRGYGAVRVARMFAESIGLTEQQAARLARYAEILAAQRGGIVGLVEEFAVDLDRPTGDVDQRKLDAMRRSMLQQRAEVVARTEAQRVLGQAQFEAMRQTLAQAGIDESRVLKTWNCTLDGRERKSHHNADGQTVRFADPFNVGDARMLFPGDMSLGAPVEERVSCRCLPTYEILADVREVAERLRA